MVGNQPNDDSNSRPTVAGCLLLLLSLAVIPGVAIPIVTWRDPDSGRPLPRLIAIVTPVLAGAVFFGIGSSILKILGLSVLSKIGESHEDANAPPPDGPDS